MSDLDIIREIEKEIGKRLQRIYPHDESFINRDYFLNKKGFITSLTLDSLNLEQIPSPIFRLSHLKTLKFRNQKLLQLPNDIVKLENLEVLDLSSNLLLELPAALVKLKKLHTLGIRFNQVSELPKWILQVNWDIGWEKHPTFKGISLKGNPLETPPAEIVMQGTEAVRNYFRQIEEGLDHIYEAKLLIVGEGGAGKTSLAKKIENHEYELQWNEDTTKGIDVIKWNFIFNDGKIFKVNIWDFGGQSIYHETHQFFLTKRSLYILVADTRNEDTDFYYWLNIVELLSDNSPLLIVKNEKQGRKREINEKQLRGQFTNLKETLATNLAGNNGKLSRIINNIKYYITNLPHIGSALPKTWVKVREKLEQDDRNYINLNEYLDICSNNGFTKENDKLQLSGYLHDLGVCLHFQDDPILKQIVIIKTEWGTDAVYKVLDNIGVINNYGKFKKSELEKIWNEDKYKGMRDQLLQLMIKFKLCYEIPGEQDTYIAPQLLTENQCDYDWDDSENLVMRYTCKEFMPKGIITRFIVEMHRYIEDQKLVWKSGVVIKEDNDKKDEFTRAEIIEYYGKREIVIRVSGKYKRDWMTKVCFKLDEILDTFIRLKHNKLIPCNCEVCKVRPNPYFHNYEKLRKRIYSRKYDIECEVSYKKVDALKLLDDIINYNDLIKEEKKRGKEISIKGELGTLIKDFGSIDKEKSEKTINIGNGATINVLVTIADSIENSFNKLSESNVSYEIKELLRELLNAVNEVNKNISPDKSSDAKRIAEDTETLTKEIINPNPRPKMLGTILDTIKDSTIYIGTVAKPVLDVVDKIIKLLPE